MLSLIICSANPTKFAAAEKRFVAQLEAAKEPFELIHIPDARSMCEGYNRAAARAKGDALLFSHDDVELLNPRFPAILRRRLASFDVLGVAGTSRLVGAGWVDAGIPHIFGQVVNIAVGGASYNVCIFDAHSRVVPNIQALDGCFFACRRDVLNTVRFDEATFDAFHCYDVDFTFSAHLAGKKLAVCCDLFPIHGSPGSFDAKWKEQAARFTKKHAANLCPQLRKGGYRFAAAEAFSKEDAVRLMSPPWWPPEDAQ